jgi:basic membrane protein A
MMDCRLTRRGLLGGAAGTAALIAARGNALAAPLTVGIVYVGPRADYGWNQAHALAARTLRAIPGVNLVEEERVPETGACRQTMLSMIKLDNAKLILGTSFGYFMPYMIDLAREYPDVQFRHPSTLWNADKHPKNLGGYFCYLDQAHYVDGIAAGLSTKNNKIGFVAAKPIDLVLRNINSFTLGARKVNPNAEVNVVFTGEWSLPVREAEVTNALIDSGCDLIACHVDSPKVVIQTAEARGIRTCGHNASQAELAPKGFVTGAENKWETVYKSYALSIGNGGVVPNTYYGGYDKDMVLNTSFGAGATDAARGAAMAAVADLKAGKPIFVGPIKDNKGKVVVEKTYDLYDPFLEHMNYLVEGVNGSLA